MFVRRWSATTWVSSPSPTSPSSTVARAWWARTRSSCRWSESIAQHRKIWLRGEVDKKCKLHLIWFATYWSVKLPAFRRNFQTHVWTHVESQNTNHGVDHRDLSMFLYVIIIFLLETLGTLQVLQWKTTFWGALSLSNMGFGWLVPNACPWASCCLLHKAEPDLLEVEVSKCAKLSEIHFKSFLSLSSSVLLSFFKSDHASSLSRSRIGMRIHDSWFVMFYRFFLFRRRHIMDSDGAWWCSAERFSCLLGETQLHADRGTRTFDSERSWWQPCWPTTSIMNITSITSITLAHC